MWDSLLVLCIFFGLTFSKLFHYFLTAFSRLFQRKNQKSKVKSQKLVCDIDNRNLNTRQLDLIQKKIKIAHKSIIDSLLLVYQRKF